jgi:hypothetical protein
MSEWNISFHFKYARENESNNQKDTFAKVTAVTSKQLPQLLEAANRISKCKKLHSTGESSLLPAAIDIVATVLCE